MWIFGRGGGGQSLYPPILVGFGRGALPHGERVGCDLGPSQTKAQFLETALGKRRASHVTRCDDGGGNASNQLTVLVSMPAARSSKWRGVDTVRTRLMLPRRRGDVVTGGGGALDALGAAMARGGGVEWRGGAENFGRGNFYGVRVFLHLSRSSLNLSLNPSLFSTLCPPIPGRQGRHRAFNLPCDVRIKLARK